jgi:hypothetical protein
MIKAPNDVIYVASTRFNDETWQQNLSYRQRRNFQGCLYGVPKEVAMTVIYNSKLYILEMNNTKPEKIIGIGIIRNEPLVKYYSIYKDYNYNRYTYGSKKRIDRSMLNEEELEGLSIFEKLVFRGKDHIKRGQGITSLPTKKMKGKKKWMYEFLKGLEVKYCGYLCCQSQSSDIDDKDMYDERSFFPIQTKVAQ